MPRLLGVEIPAKKKVAFSLRYINGIGPTRADLLVKEAGLSPDMRAQDLTEEQLNKILHIITEHKWVLEGDLRRELAANLKRLQAINCYRGVRHRRSLPVRGQRTSTNARTRKGPRKTVGVTKEKPAKPAPEGAPAAAPAEKKAKGPKADKAGKPAAEGAAPAAAGEAAPKAAAKAAPAASDKPVELVGGVAKQPTAEDLLKEELGTIKVRKAKGSKNVISGYANVLASFNNTIVSITDQKGQVIAWSSAGKCNFRGSRKSTAYAAQVVAQDAARNAMSHGLKDVQIRVSGPGLGRDSAIRALQAIGLEITSIVDVTPIPHNGCRPRKRRRV